ncbi:MAG: hypothetical protein WDO16_06430 [Bacteroidota bacterium]
MNVPVTLSNTTDKSASVTANIATDGSVKIVGSSSQTVSLNAKSEGRASFQVVANTTIGIGNVKITVSGLGEKFEDATAISVRPPSTLQKVTGSGSIAVAVRRT